MEEFTYVVKVYRGPTEIKKMLLKSVEKIVTMDDKYPI